MTPGQHPIPWIKRVSALLGPAALRETGSLASIRDLAADAKGALRHRFPEPQGALSH